MVRELLIDDKKYSVNFEKVDKNHYTFQIEGKTYPVEVKHLDAGYSVFAIDENLYKISTSFDDKNTGFVTFEGNNFIIKDARGDGDNITGDSSDKMTGADNNVIVSDIPGKVIKINVSDGDAVKKGDCLIIIEAMKMENSLVAPMDAKIKSVSAKAGELVDAGVTLISLEKV